MAAHPCFDWQAALDAVEPAILEKLSEYDFRTSREVTDLVDVAKGNPELTKYGLLLSAALLGNKEADMFANQVINFIQVVTSVKDGAEDPNEKKHDQVLCRRRLCIRCTDTESLPRLVAGDVFD